MPYTNPNSISNSGNSYFTNQKSKIYIHNLNIINNADQYNNFLNQQFINNLSITPNKYTPQTNTTNDFLFILQTQKKNSKLNKLLN